MIGTDRSGGCDKASESGGLAGRSGGTNSFWGRGAPIGFGRRMSLGFLIGPTSWFSMEAVADDTSPGALRGAVGMHSGGSYSNPPDVHL